MTGIEEAFNVIECPKKIEGCLGLAVSSLGEVKIERKDGGYIARTRNGKEFHGNCQQYERCYAMNSKLKFIGDKS